MSQRLSISAIVFFVLMTLLGVYFAYAAVQGPSGILRRVQLEAETRDLIRQRDSLQAEGPDAQPDPSPVRRISGHRPAG